MSRRKGRVRFGSAVIQIESSLRADADHYEKPRKVRNPARRAGRPPVRPELIAELQAELEAHWRGKRKPKQPDGVTYIQAQPKGKWLGRTTIERKIVRPVYQRLWPK
jgi:hypothetical protein